MVQWNKAAAGLACLLAIGVAATATAQTTANAIRDLDAPPARIGPEPIGKDWPQFLGPSVDGRTTERGLRRDWAGDGLPLRWKFRLGESYGIGVAAYGRFYQFDRDGEHEVLYCLDAHTGKRLWRFRYPCLYQDLYGYNGGPRCSPLVDGGRVYLYGVQGMLHCLNAETGAPVWKVDTRERFGVIQNFFGVGSNPIIHQDLLWVMVGGSPAADRQLPAGALDRVRGNGSGLVAFDKRTGEVRHQFSDELASYASLKVASIRGVPWCFAFARGGLIGFDPRNGEQRFQFPWRARILESVQRGDPSGGRRRAVDLGDLRTRRCDVANRRGRTHGGLARRSRAEQGAADALEYARASRWLCLCLQRPAHLRRGPAVRAVEDRQSHVDTARHDPLFDAWVGRRPDRVVGERRSVHDRGDSSGIPRNHSRPADARCLALSVLGGADRVTRVAVRSAAIGTWLALTSPTAGPK